MHLTATNISLEAVLDGAHATTAPDFSVEWADNTVTGLTGGHTDGVMNGATPVTITAAPAASTVRQVKRVNIHNRDTVSHTVTVSINNNGTLRRQCRIGIAPNQSLIYE